MMRAPMSQRLGRSGRIRRWLLAGLLMAWPALASAQATSDAASPALIRVTGSPADRTLLERLQQAFRAQHPGIEFSNTLYGPESSLAGVYTGTADLAWMARELREPMERMAFEWVVLDKPYAITVAYAGFNADRPARQLAVYVADKNPLTQLSLQQLDSVLGSEHLRGGAAVTRWRDLGVTGAASEQAVSVYGPRVDSIDGLFVRRLVMKDSRKWKPTYRQFDDAAAILTAVARDPSGLAIAPAGLRTPGLREVPLADVAAAPSYAANRDSITQDRYPLARTVEVVVINSDKQPLRAEVRAFLQFVLSPSGQQIIANEGNNLPLSQQRLAQQRARMN